ncbi:uncharacterized protein [Ptychodera flava]|uniref:uncharacterized protein n=1 Tax=Ptychodera flava TaxID=63121 RepID=UPI00396A9F91
MSDIPIDPDLDGELVQLLQDRHDEISSVYCPESENADIANSQLSSVSILTPPDASLEVTSEDDDDDGSVDISEASQLASLFNDNQQVNGVDGLRDTGPNVDLDRAAVRATFEKGCGCKDECFGKLKLDVVFHHRLNMAEFTKDQRDILILAKLDENSYSGDTVRGGKRECQRFIYKFDGVKVCEKVWRYCYYVGVTAFKNLKRHYKENGVIPRRHGLKGRKPVNTYTFEVIEDVVQFLIRYADEKGLPMPAAPRGRDDHPPIYLPSCDTKAEVYDRYTESCQQSDPPRMAVGETTFRNIWSSCVPHIKRMEPRTDVCPKCEAFRQSIQYATSESDKLTVTTEFSNHILSAQSEREFCNELIKMATAEYEPVKELIKPGHYNFCCNNLSKVHYTFDFAQSFLLPHQSRQVGPLYFLNPMKVNCFGIHNEACKLQMNYLFDESQTIQPDNKKCHGPNNVISMLDDFLRNFGLGEKCASFHADNCSGQNKNKSLLHYFIYRCSKGKHEITYHFMEAGHTKCVCDSAFGKIRQLYRRSDVDTMAQLCNVVNKSSKVNSSAIHVFRCIR